MNEKLEDIKDRTAVNHGWRDYDTIVSVFQSGGISQYAFDDYLQDVVEIYAGEE